MRKPNSFRTGVILGLAAILAACGSGDKDYRVVDTIESQEQPIVLEFAPSSLAFGPADIRVTRGSGPETAVVYEGKISNDGGDITLDNLRPIADKPGFLWLCLNGVEQNDMFVRIDYASSAIVELERPCVE